MHSRVASEIARIDRDRFAAMTPAERVAFALKLSAEGLAAYMATHQVDRATARDQIAATRRAGRVRSKSAERS